MTIINRLMLHSEIISPNYENHKKHKYTLSDNLRDPDDRIAAFWTFSIVRYSRKQETRRFGNSICFRPQVRGKTPTKLGPLERANHNYWKTPVRWLNSCVNLTGIVQWLRLALSEGPNWVGVFPPSHMRTKTDPVSETSCFLFSRIPNDGESPKTQ
jgi:hypothetical protein